MSAGSGAATAAALVEVEEFLFCHFSICCKPMQTYCGFRLKGASLSLQGNLTIVAVAPPVSLLLFNRFQYRLHDMFTLKDKVSIVLHGILLSSTLVCGGSKQCESVGDVFSSMAAEALLPKKVQSQIQQVCQQIAAAGASAASQCEPIKMCILVCTSTGA